MTARATLEARCHAALSRYKIAIAEGTWRVTADNALVDAILKAADVYALGADAVRQRDQVRAADLDAAIAALRQQESDEATARRRDIIDGELSAIAVRKLRHTAGAR